MKEIDTYEQFFDHAFNLTGAVIRGLDFTRLEINWKPYQLKDACFLQCRFNSEDIPGILDAGAFILSSPVDLPYQPFRKGLYTWQELLQAEDGEETRDLKIYRHFSKSRFNAGMQEALWQRIHDYAIDSAMDLLFDRDENGASRLKCVAVMGGHGMPRTSNAYLKVALLCQQLSRLGYFICSGGGPGIMEAANLGACLATYEADAIYDSISIMKDVPHYTSPGYLEASIRVLEKYPDHSDNLAIPTWFYGHEPSNVFASDIAKYFSNSIREDTLLAIALHGIIFAPGSAGTTQEIFMDAAQNHYGTYNYYSPMVFLDRKHYEHDTMIFPILKKLSWGREYSKLIFISDEIEEIIQFILDHPPIRK